MQGCSKKEESSKHRTSKKENEARGQTAGQQEIKIYCKTIERKERKPRQDNHNTNQKKNYE